MPNYNVRVIPGARVNAGYQKATYTYVLLTVIIINKHKNLSQRTKEQLGCTPWNQPHTSKEDVFCTRHLSSQFTNNLSSFSSSPGCQSSCLPDCDVPIFNTYIDTVALDYNRECENPIVMNAALKNLEQTGDR